MATAMTNTFLRTIHHYELTDSTPLLRADPHTLKPYRAHISVYPTGEVTAWVEGRVVRKSDGQIGAWRGASFKEGDEMPQWLAELVAAHSPVPTP